MAMHVCFQKYPEMWEFMQNVANTTNSRNSIDVYRRGMEMFGEYIMGEGVETVYAVQKKHVLGYRQYLINKGFAQKSLAVRFAAVKSMYNFLVREGKMEDTPIPNTPIAKGGRMSAIPAMFTPRMIFAIREQRFCKTRTAVLFEMLLSSGMRIGEFQQLRANHIEWGIAPVDLTTNKASEFTAARIRLMRTRTQTKREKTRVTYISQLAGRLMKRHLESMRIPLDSDHKVFPWSRSDVRHMLKKLMHGVPGAKEALAAEDPKAQDSTDIDLDDDVDTTEEYKRLIAANIASGESFKRRNEGLDPSQKRLSLPKSNFKAHGLRYAFTCLMYYRSYHGERHSEIRVQRMLGHTGISTTHHYLFELDMIPSDDVWIALMLGRKQDWFATV